MREQEFLNINPAQKYGNGVAGLLYSSSVVNPEDDQTPVAPFVIQGLTLPNTSKSGVDVTDTSNVKVKFEVDANNTQTYTLGNTGHTNTGFSFIRLGDT